jgi:putative intracellular protease/amidase
VAAVAAETRKVLMIFSNGAAMGATTAKNNLWEYAEPHHVFVMHGYVVDFVSPQGGRVPFSLDADETDPPGMVSYTIRYEGFRQKADRTLKPEQVTAGDYVAAFIGGGAGSLFDAANDRRLLSVIASIYENGGVVGAGGHGPGSLGDVKLSNGKYLVSGKRITGFPNASEQNSKWTNAGALLPFRVEDRLRARGALFLTKADLADKHDAVIDQRIVTTMFLPSSAIVAQEMVNLLQPTAPAGH